MLYAYNRLIYPTGIRYYGYPENIAFYVLFLLLLYMCMVDS